MFRCHFGQLVCGVVQPDLLASQLYSKGLIDKAVKSDNVTTTVGGSANNKTITLMNTVETKIKVDPRPAQVMRELCEVIETETALQPVVRSTRKALGESNNASGGDCEGGRGGRGSEEEGEERR